MIQQLVKFWDSRTLNFLEEFGIQLLRKNQFLNMGLSSVDFVLYFTDKTRCRPKALTKNKLPNVDFDLYFTDTTPLFHPPFSWTCDSPMSAFTCILPVWLAVSKKNIKRNYTFRLLGESFLTLRPFGPLVFARAPKGAFRTPSAIKKLVLLKGNNNFF